MDLVTAPPVAPRLRTTAVRTARDLAFLLGGLLLGVVSLAVAVAGLTAGISLLVVGIGVPVLAATLVACRGLAARERRAVERATGHALPPHHYRTAGDRTPRVRDVLRDRQCWWDALHAVVLFPVGILTAVVALTCTVGGVGGLLYGAWEWALPHGDGDHSGLFALVTGVRSRPVDIAVNTALGVGLLLAAPRVLHAMVLLRAAVARLLLTRPTAALQARADQLAASRRSAVRAEAQVLRRLERDLHDGPQQRLVRLGMDLESAGRRLDDPEGDPQRARTLIAEALTQSREALAELRALSRGIAPPILADRGLGPALAAAAARSPVPVSLDVALPDGARPPAAVENAAYFVVTEALTNVAKHARARSCAVAVRSDGARLVVTVRDDGVGGAHLGKGHGLAGLADRAAAVDGHLEVVSPPGGPTVVRAELPLAGVGES
jgi:signal transduction histidine kinase